VVKIMDRTAPGSVSFGQKMEYNRGKTYAISLSDVGFHFYRRSLHKKFWKVINYWRYSILGEVGAIRSTQMWSVISSNPLYLLLYPIGGILALRDIVKGKVVWTHREFEYAKDNVKITVSKYGK